MLSFIVTQLLVATNALTGIPATMPVEQDNSYSKFLENSQTLIVSSNVANVPIVRDELSVEVAALPQISRVSFSGAQSTILNTALSLRGVPYVANASDPSVGFDCSGFVKFVYAQHGVSLPHSASAQAALGTVISESEALPGDLLFWGGHIGFWVSPGMMVDSAVPGTVVEVRPIWGNPLIIRL